MSFFLFLIIQRLWLTESTIPNGFTRFEHGCSWAMNVDYQPKEYIRNPTPYEFPPISPSALPTNFSWDDQNGISLVTPVRNQGLPFNCGSCWAVSSVAAISDRLKINEYRNNKKVITDINLAPQFALDVCADGSGLDIECGSCNGGSSHLLYQALHKTGISDESCNPYLGVTTSHWGELGYEEYMCRTCNRFGDCNYTAANPDLIFFVDEYGVINYQNYINNTQMTMVDAMQQEIYNRGPIVCSMYAHADSFENYQGGILTDKTKYDGTTHDLVILGWGQSSNGIKYWIGRNSFGTFWGGPQKGFFLAERGINIYNMEEVCTWATIKKTSNAKVTIN